MQLIAIDTFVIAFVLTLLCAGRGASSPQASTEVEHAEFLGLRIAESLPMGLKSHNHFMIASKRGAATPLEFGVREVSKGKVKMLWFERIAERDQKRVLGWQVLDVLILPPIKKHQVLATSSCFIAKEFEPEVIALFDNQDNEYLTRTRRAWRANRLTGKFEDLPVRGVRCKNESWSIP